MKNLIGYFLLFGALNGAAQLQGDYIQYMFNGVLFNPAYAGSQNALNLTALYRNQWMGIEGSPVSKSFSAHGPLKNKKVNLGLVIENEKFGVFDHTKLNLLYAYRIKFMAGTLALGLSAGLDVATNNWNNVITTEANDPNFAGGATRNLSVIAGSGVYYQTERFYVGAACPQLLDHNSFDKYRTVVFNSGFLSDISENFKIKPAVLIKYLAGSPLAANVTTTFYYKEIVGAGIGYTHNSSVMCFADIRFNDQLRFGYGYDYSVNRLRSYSGGSHEIMLRYLFSFKVKAVSARYF